VALRTLEVQAIQDVTIMAMASLAETRDDETGNHIRRTQLYVSDPTGRARTPSRRNLLGARWSTVAVRATHDRQAIGAFWARTLAWSGCVFDIGEAHGSRLACFDHPV
jgi:putative two-component system response regulator